MTTKFDLGEQVFGIVEDIKYVDAECKYCENGIIELKGVKFLCPACGGDAEAPTRYYKVEGPLTVNRIIISRTEGTVYGFPETEADYCEIFIKENMIFKSKEEANKFLKDEITRSSEQ